MGFKKNLKQALSMVDFFNSSQMLRYQHESQYRTVTGGIISIGIIVTIIIAFASMIMSTFNMDIITYTESTRRSIDPETIKMTLSPQNNNMFGVKLVGYDLNEDQRVFDVFANRLICKNGCQIYQTIPIQLEPCRKDHWTSVEEVAIKSDKLQIDKWLCPKINTEFELGGKQTSDEWKMVTVEIRPCSNDTNPNKTCGSAEKVDEYFIANEQSFFMLYSVNAMINLDQKQYMQYYLEDNHFLRFSRRMGLQLNLFYSEVTINSDLSILPYENIKTEKVNLLNINPSLYPFEITNSQPYAIYFLRKDQASITYTRHIQKIQEVFSFIGGIIGAILGLLFALNSYTSFSFQLSIAYKVFKKYESKERKQENDTEEEKQQKIKHENLSVNIFDFFKYCFYACYRYYKRYKGQNSDQNPFPEMEYLYECRQEILNQLDIKGLMQRIIFLQYSMNYLFEDYQIQAMKVNRPNNPGGIKGIRQLVSAQTDLYQNQDQMVQQQQVQEDSAHNLIIIKKESQEVPKFSNIHDQDQKIQPQNKIKKMMNSGLLQVDYQPSLEVQGRQSNLKRKDIFLQANLKDQIIQDHKLDEKLDLQNNKLKKKTIVKFAQSIHDGNVISKKIWSNMINQRSKNKKLQKIIFLSKKIIQSKRQL